MDKSSDEIRKFGIIHAASFRFEDKKRTFTWNKSFVHSSSIYVYIRFTVVAHDGLSTQSHLLGSLAWALDKLDMFESGRLTLCIDSNVIGVSANP
jgi:hypothetical protein